MAAKNRKVILVVDDEADFALIVKKNLQKKGFNIDIAYDGTQALEKIRSDPPCAVILDMIMPEKSGKEVCAELKNDSRLRSIPVILLSSVPGTVGSTRFSTLPKNVMGADDYLPKPASVEEIIQCLEKLAGPFDKTL
ncbi:MAG: response regulator [Desulfococcus sp. 4484_241]|nr:MAG: response regulator [Desulfococcus sp. 4484_241]